MTMKNVSVKETLSSKENKIIHPSEVVKVSFSKKHLSNQIANIPCRRTHLSNHVVKVHHTTIDRLNSNLRNKNRIVLIRTYICTKGFYEGVSRVNRRDYSNTKEILSKVTASTIAKMKNLLK